MRVRIVHPTLGEIGGAEVLMIEQARLLAGRGARVRIRTASFDETRFRDRLGPIPVEARAAATRRRGPRSPEDPRVRWLLEDLGDEDLVIAHNYPASAALGLGAAGPVKIWYCHEPPRGLYPREASPFLSDNVARAPSRAGPRYYRTSLNGWFGALPLVGRRRPARLELDGRGVRALHAIWANSEFTRDNARRVYGSIPVEVLYPTIVFPEPSPRSGSRRSGLRVLTLSRLHPVKNLDTLLDGFLKYRAERDPSAELHVVGDGPSRSELERHANVAGAPGAVHFHGFLAEPALAALAARCDAFAFVPLDEPFGMVFPEAMARGLLVLGPSHGGPLEILDGGALGELVDALSVEAIAEGLARLAALSDGEADRRRARAADSVKQRFSREVTDERLGRLLRAHGLSPAG